MDYRTSINILIIYDQSTSEMIRYLRKIKINNKTLIFIINLHKGLTL